MEGHGRKLEGDGDDHHRGTREQDRLAAGAEPGSQLGEPQRAGLGEQQRHAEQHEGRCGGRKNEVLDAPFERAAVLHRVGHHRVEGDRHELEADEEACEMAAHGHHHRAERGHQQQQIELFAIALVAFEIRAAERQHAERAGKDQTGVEEGIAVHHQQRRHRYRLAVVVEPQQGQREQRQVHAENGHGTDEVVAAREGDVQHHAHGGEREQDQRREIEQLLEGHGATPTRCLRVAQWVREESRSAIRMPSEIARAVMAQLPWWRPLPGRSDPPSASRTGSCRARAAGRGQGRAAAP